MANWNDACLKKYDPIFAGSDGYPEAWHSDVKHLVRELAGHRCIRCGHPYRSGRHGKGEWTPCDEQCIHCGPFRVRDTNGPWPEGQCESFGSLTMAGAIVAAGFPVEARWRILTVHHFDCNKLNCRWWNLGALCQKCHLSVQNRAKFDRPYVLEHSKWMKPYVAGFYAWKYERLELSREEVMSRLDELLSHERKM